MRGTRLGKALGMVGLCALGTLFPGCRSADSSPTHGLHTQATGATPDPQFDTQVVLPAWTGQTRTGEIDAQGRVVSLQCTACHSELEERQTSPTAEELTQVHVGLKMEHGGLACFSCHDNRSDYEFLRLADGTSVEYADVMQLCSQCHGPQRRDYDNGAHGGMSGYWDLSRGPRERNACTVCHDPHAPAFPHMRPQFKPRDRFLTPSSSPEGHDAH